MDGKLSFIAIILLFPVIVLSQSIGSPHYNSTQSGTSIADAANYIQSINESGFLIFQPNLTLSYSYLALATKFQNSSPNTAVFYAQKARSEALQQYQDIDYYRSRSIPVIVAFAIIFFLILLKLNIPVAKRDKHSNKNWSRR